MIWVLNARCLVIAAFFVAFAIAFSCPAAAGNPTLVPQPPITAPASIPELAEALGNDANTIFEYVYTNIEYLPTFGTKKGALGTLLDGRGGAFDQSALLVALLRQAGYDANFVYGKIRIYSETQLNNWLGTDSSGTCTGWRVLQRGGVPSQLYAYEATCDPGHFAYIDINHVWVSAKGKEFGNEARVYDPAYKLYTTPKAGIDLAAVMEYDQDDFIDAVEEGATVTAASVKSLNKQNLQSRLSQYANKLVAHIRSTMPTATIDDVIGGRYIRPLTQPYTPPTTNPRQYGAALATWSEIPDEYRTTFEVQIGGVDETYFSDEIYGHRLTIVYDSSNRPELYLDGVVQGTGTENAKTVDYTVTFPYCLNISGPEVPGCPSGSTNVYSKQSNLKVGNGFTFAILHGWDNTGPGMVEFHRRLLQQYKSSGADPSSEPLLGQTLNTFGYSWLAQLANTKEITGQIVGTRSYYHCDFGVAGQTIGPYIDMPGGLSSNRSFSADTSRSTTSFYSGVGHLSSLESGVIEQNLSALNIGAVSTAKLLDMANEQDLTVFDATSANWSSVASQLQNYESADINGVSALISNGYRVILPQNGSLTQGIWTGVGYIGISSTESSISYAISSNIKGGNSGGSVSDPDLNTQVVGTTASYSLSDFFTQTWSLEPISLATGAYMHNRTDLSVGGSGTGLAFKRIYNSAGRYADGPLGLGWTHNFASTAAKGSDGFVGMGQNNAIDAAAAIVELYVSQDLLSDTKKPLNKMMIATMAQQWFMDRLTDNTVNVTTGGNTEQYVLLADGTYNQPMASSNRLSLIDDRYRVTAKDGSVTDFNENGTVASWSSPAGMAVSYAYDTGEPTRLTSVSNNLGRRLSFAYDAEGRITAVNDNAPTPRQVTYGYDSDGDLTSFTDTLGNATTYAYGTEAEPTPGLLTKIFKPSLPSGVPFVTNTYDSLGRVSAQANAANDAEFDTTWHYRFAGYRTEEIDPTGTRRVLYMNPRGRTLFDIKDFDGLGLTTKTLYDGRDRTVSVTNPEGDSFAYEYESEVNPWADNVATLTRNSHSYLAPVVTTFTYDPAWNKPVTVTDPLGRVTRNFYDPATGTLTRTVGDFSATGINAQTRFTYDDHGLPLTVTDPMGTVTANRYDGFGNRIETVTDPAGLAVTRRYAYDGTGNLIAATDANGHATTFTWDTERRQLSETAPGPFDAGALRVATAWTDDEDGNVTAVTRANGATPQVTETTYTDTGKVATVTDPLGRVTSFTYDRNDRLAVVTDPLGRTVTNGYDALGRLVSVTDPLGRTAETRTYTANGALATLTDANGNVTRVIYDGFDRVSTVTYADGTGLARKERFFYDNVGNVTLWIMRSGQPILMYYDRLNRLVAKTGAFPEYYSYDLAGHLLRVSGSYTTIRAPSGAAAAYVTSMAYDALDRPLKVEFSPAPTQTVPTTASVTTAHSYNAVDQRIGETVSDDTWMRRPAAVASTTNYTANALNQYSAVGVVTPTYNTNGDLTYDGTFTYAFDAENRLTGITGGGLTASYTYDSRGRRKSRTVNGTTTIYVTDLADRVVLEYDGSTGAPLAWTAQGPGLDAPLARIDLSGGTRTGLIPDIQGSVIGELASTGTLTKTAYLPYGENDTPPGTGQRYTARRLDPETAGSASQPSGLYYYRARTYSPAWGRFLQPDPIGVTGGINLYAYVLNDPLNAVDPSGLVLESVTSYLSDSWNALSRAPGDIAGMASDIVNDPAGFAQRIGPTVAGAAPVAGEFPVVVSSANRALRVLGSASSTRSSSQDIVFGTNQNATEHAFRHIDKLKLDRGGVMGAIRQDLQRNLPIRPSSNNAPFQGSVTVNGVQLEYHAFPINNGSTVNVGRITAP